jgi:hypothetical protein
MALSQAHTARFATLLLAQAQAQMIVSEPPSLHKQLERQIHARTGKRVRNLEIQCSSGEVTLSGETSTYHVKQLAQQGVLEIMPTIRLHNRITVH